MSAAKDKGNTLEYAVECIVKAMHLGEAKLQGATVTVERNKIIVRNNVSYEIDLWIHIDQGDLYQGIHILECKNWKKPVGAGEVRNFAVKVEDLGATSGTIIARRFTSDAYAQAKNHKRLNLHLFADDFWSPIKSLVGSIVTHSAENITATLHFWDRAPEIPATLEPSCLLHRAGVEIGTLGKYIDLMIFQHMQSQQAVGKTGLPEGETRSRAHLEKSFEPGECLVIGHRLALIAVEMDVLMTVIPGRTVLKFDVQERGGFMKIEFPPGTLGHKEVSMEIVTKKSDGPHISSQQNTSRSNA